MGSQADSMLGGEAPGTIGSEFAARQYRGFLDGGKCGTGLDKGLLSDFLQLRLLFSGTLLHLLLMKPHHEIRISEIPGNAGKPNYLPN